MKIFAFTDGGCSNNGKRNAVASFASVIIDGKSKKIIRGRVFPTEYMLSQCCSSNIGACIIGGNKGGEIISGNKGGEIKNTDKQIQPSNNRGELLGIIHCLNYLVNNIKNSDTLYNEHANEQQQSDALSKNSNTLSKNSNTLSKNSNTLSKNSDALSKNSDALSKNSDTLSKNSDTLSKNSDALSKNKDDLSKNSDTLSKNSDSLSKNSDALCNGHANGHANGYEQQDVDIISDSLISIKTFNLWLPERRKKNTAHELKNFDLISIAETLLNQCKEKYTINFIHVNSHQKEPVVINTKEHFFWKGNQLADEHCFIALKNENYDVEYL